MELRVLVAEDARRQQRGVDGAGLADGQSGDRNTGRPALDALLEERGVQVVTFRDWLRIEGAEASRAREGSPREKFTRITEMLAALKG